MNGADLGRGLAEAIIGFVVIALLIGVALGWGIPRAWHKWQHRGDRACVARLAGAKTEADSLRVRLRDDCRTMRRTEGA